MLSSQAIGQMRHPNKEPEWSSLCNNVFDQFLDTDELFGIDANQIERNSSQDSVNLFDFSGSSEQSQQTECTSPLPPWEPSAQGNLLEAKQPQAKEPVTFWTKTLRALEQNAAECEKRQRKLRSTKSHPDFLSLGGYPSPPAIPYSPTDQSSHSQPRPPRSAASGNTRNITARSLSRGRPTGVTKAAVAGCVNPHATVRKCSASPPKMMTPSRYRAGFKDFWMDKVQRSPKKYELKLPSTALPDSPPLSVRARQTDNFAAFGSAPNCPVPLGYDEHISPLTNTFQQTHLHTPFGSPGANYIAHASNASFEPLPPLPGVPPAIHASSTNDTAPLYPDRAPSLAANRIGSFDFGFSSPSEATTWDSHLSPRTLHSTYALNAFAELVPLGAINPRVIPTTETYDISSPGLGIVCDPSMISVSSTMPPTPTASNPPYRRYAAEASPYYVPPHPNRLPSTSHHHSRSRHRSLSPSPPATEPLSTRTASSSRRASRHRRTKSSNTTPRHPRNAEKGGFVNFTADDSTKILSGVAPSGSSKTKARREQEAADKRRRLSQAAIRAIVEAGGNLDGLTRAGLLG